MDLSVVTREAVLGAIAECDRLGRDRFLEEYGFKPAHRYFLHYEGVYYDSKAIVGVAYRHVAGRPLAAREFSGGRKTVGQRLENLKFEVVVDEPLSPRRRLVELLGSLGDAGIVRHEPMAILWAAGRAAARRPRLVSWQDTQSELRRLMREYGQSGSPSEPEFPFLALARTGLWELQGYVGDDPAADDGQNPYCGLAAWAYELVASDGAARAEVVSTLGGRFFNGGVPEGLLVDVGLRKAKRRGASFSDSLEVYWRLCSSVEAAEARGDHDRTTSSTREQPVRSLAARDAVRVRSGGRCENPLCAGQPDDVTKNGDAILEVDHVQDRAKWGRDHPIQMIALCPNCHAVKTRGRTGERLRELLSAEARARHTAWTNRH